MTAIRATRPIVRPTAPPVPRLPLLLFCVRFSAFPVAVGITVIVWTWPIVVKIEMIGVKASDVDVEAEFLLAVWEQLAKVNEIRQLKVEQL